MDQKVQRNRSSKPVSLGASSEGYADGGSLDLVLKPGVPAVVRGDLQRIQLVLYEIVTHVLVQSEKSRLETAGGHRHNLRVECRLVSTADGESPDQQQPPARHRARSAHKARKADTSPDKGLRSQGGQRSRLSQDEMSRSASGAGSLNQSRKEIKYSLHFTINSHHVIARQRQYRRLFGQPARAIIETVGQQVLERERARDGVTLRDTQQPYDRGEEEMKDDRLARESDGRASRGFDMSDDSLRLSDDLEVLDDDMLRFGPDHLFVRHAKMIIQSLQGKIWVSSSAFTGSFFHITVPVQLEERSEGENQTNQDGSSRAGPAAEVSFRKAGPHDTNLEVQLLAAST